MSEPQQAIIIRNDSQMTVSYSAAAVALKESALASGALIGKVTNSTEQAEAVPAQVKLQGIISLAERARKACKKPVLAFGAKIDATHDEFVADLLAEMTRISSLVGSFQQLEQAKARAAEQARNMELTKLERERAEKIAQATSDEAIDAIQEHYNRLAETIPVHEPVRAEGQRVTTDWEITVTDIHKLYRMHANCVELKPRLLEIKNLLKMGVTVAGVTAKPIVKAGVIIPKDKAAIEV